MKYIVVLLLIGVSIGVKADTLYCTYVSSTGELENGFLTSTTAEFNCGGKLVEFIGDNIYVRCRPQFALAEFTKKLSQGELVRFNIQAYEVSSIDGSRKELTMVKQATSATGYLLEPQTIIQHGKPVKCDSTQIVVR